MAKKMVFVLVLAVLVAGGVFADWYDTYAPGIDQGNVFINGGIGFGVSAFEMGIPPLSVSADFKLPIEYPVTLGGILTYNTWNYAAISSSSYLGVPVPESNIDVTYTNIGFGVRIMYHFNFLVENLDTYAGLTLGWVMQSADIKYGKAYDYLPDSYKTDYPAVSFFLYGFNVGGRYFFTENIGAYLEIGYSGLQVAGLGLSVKI